MYSDKDAGPSTTGEVISATLRELAIDVQAIEVRVDATMIQFDVHALLVSSNPDALRRVHFFYEVTFTDGSFDDGLVMTADFVWPDEAVIFTDDGLEATVPFHWGDDEAVVFTEEASSIALAVNYAEFVHLTDYAINYILDFHWFDQARFSDISIAWMGIGRWDENVFVNESMNVLGGNTVALRETVSISEVLIGGPAVIFGDAVFLAELWFYVMDFQIQPDFVTWTDALVVSEVAATDARPGAFVPGSALLGSPQ